MEQSRKLWFFEDTVKLAELSVFPLVDKQAAISFMQLFCHRLNDILQKEGEEAVMELIFYGNAIKKENKAFRDYRSEKGGVKYTYQDPQDPTKGILTSIPRKDSSSSSEVAEKDKRRIEDAVDGSTN